LVRGALLLVTATRPAKTLCSLSLWPSRVVARFHLQDLRKISVGPEPDARSTNHGGRFDPLLGDPRLQRLA